MVLRMSRPVRHPKTGIYQFRKRVPDDLRSVLGKREEKVSLKTRDPWQAQIEYLRVASEVSERWENLRKGRLSLSRRQAQALAGECYQLLVDRHNDETRFYGVLREACEDELFLSVRDGQIDFGKHFRTSMKLGADIRNKKILNAVLTQKGVLLTEESVDLVLSCMETAGHQARQLIRRQYDGDYRPDPDADRFPEWEAPVAANNKKIMPPKVFGLIGIFDEYSKDYSHSEGTRDRWRPILSKVAEEHPDIRTIDKDWCFEWRDRLLAEGLGQSTVQDSYLAALKSTCNWAVQKRLIKTNPVEGVKVRIRRKKGEEQRGFTIEEANLILPAAVQEFNENLSPEHRDARRWLPWLCAYTGARVGEMAQLRKKDLRQVGDVWLLWITPEAGTQKTISERFVAVHPHLIEQGFIDFVKNKQDGPLFFDPRRARNSKRSNSQSRKVSERVGAWVRSLGIKDKRVWPNHGWRHRFKTVARKVKMDPGTRDYLQGHVPHNEAEEYGEYEPEVLYDAIAKLPKYDVF